MKLATDKGQGFRTDEIIINKMKSNSHDPILSVGCGGGGIVEIVIEEKQIGDDLVLTKQKQQSNEMVFKHLWK